MPLDTFQFKSMHIIVLEGWHHPLHFTHYTAIYSNCYAVNKICKEYLVLNSEVYPGKLLQNTHTRTVHTNKCMSLCSLGKAVLSAASNNNKNKYFCASALAK